MSVKNFRILGNTFSDLAYKSIVAGIIFGGISAMVHFVGDIKISKSNKKRV